MNRDQFQKWIDEHALSYINVLKRPSVRDCFKFCVNTKN